MEYLVLMEDVNFLVYFIGTLYIFINSQFREPQKFIIIYVLAFCLIVFNLLDVYIVLIILIISSFIYISYLTDDAFKNKIVVTMLDKIKNFLYVMIFQYGILQFVFAILIINIQYDTSCKYMDYLLFILSFLFFSSSLKHVSSQKYLIRKFNDIKQIMDEVVPWYEFNIKTYKKQSQMFELLVNIEDQSFFIRDRKYNFLNFKFVFYRIAKLFKNRKGIGKIVRGYSTIEMQLIRSIGIECGYKLVLRRKVYEFIYSTLFFKNLRNYYDYFNGPLEDEIYKKYLLYIYINIVPIIVNGIKYKNIYKLWNKVEFDELTKEEIFISILCLSGKKMEVDILSKYSWCVTKYRLDVTEIKERIKVFEY